MKVFISWSGEKSKKIGEAFRDWLPSVLQSTKPYFTPHDIEKGDRWQTSIAKELEEAQIGILCITQENIHSDWMLFEAGALSKQLHKCYVCPILFGIKNTDLSGPLKQFQTTEFSKKDFNKLIGIINERLNESKLASKTLEVVFEKWWPEFETRINELLQEKSEEDKQVRTDRELLEEVVSSLRLTLRKQEMLGTSTAINPSAISQLLENYLKICHQQIREYGGYQDSLDILEEMRKPLIHISNKFRHKQIANFVDEISNLSYQVSGKEKESDDEEIHVPF